MHATTENTNRVLWRITLEERDFVYSDEELIQGKSLVINRVGLLWIYMGDDHRSNPCKQIIVSRGGDLAYLDIQSKIAVELTNIDSVML